MKKVIAAVVTYNRKALLKECIENLLSQTAISDLDILIVDNASTDGTKEYIQEFIDRNQIIYENTGANLGGAGGFQYGIRYAAKHAYEFVWVMDDDCMPTKTALDELLQADEVYKGKYGFLSSKVLWTDQSICAMNIQKTSLSKKVLDFNSDCVPICTATFVSTFIPIRVVLEVGLPIKEFFIWCDDLEYTRRISMRYPCYLINKSVVHHKTVSNVGSNIAIDRHERLERYRYAYRNEMYYFRREGIKGKLYAFVRLFLHMFRVLFRSKDFKWKRMKIIVSSTLKGINFNPEIEYC